MSKLSQVKVEQPEIINGVIHNLDGSRVTEKKKLRLISIPKLDYRVKPKELEGIDDKIEFQIKEVFDMFCENDYAKPESIRDGLKSVDFHLKNPEIYKVIEAFCLQCQLENFDVVTFPKFMNYMNDHLGDTTTWVACGKVFNNMKDQKLFETEQKSEITEDSLHKILESIGEKLSLEDVSYLLNLVSDGLDPNIVQDEFYYLMNKRPIEYDALANITKGFK